MLTNRELCFKHFGLPSLVFLVVLGLENNGILDNTVEDILHVSEYNFRPWR